MAGRRRRVSSLKALSSEIYPFRMSSVRRDHCRWFIGLERVYAEERITGWKGSKFGNFLDSLLTLSCKSSAPRCAADHCAQQSGQIRMYVPLARNRIFIRCLNLST